MLPTKFQLIWLHVYGFREKQLIDQSQTRTAYDSHISCMISTAYGNCVQDLPYIIPTKQILLNTIKTENTAKSTVNIKRNKVIWKNNYIETSYLSNKMLYNSLLFNQIVSSIGVDK